MLYILAAQPNVSGLHDFDYPSLADPKIGLGAMPEVGSVRKIPLPAELVEQFGRILYKDLAVTVVHYIIIE